MVCIIHYVLLIALLIALLIVAAFALWSKTKRDWLHCLHCLH